jgi:hypothetical protein
MTKSNAVKVARTLLWGAFLLVSLLTGGLSLSPSEEFRLTGMFQAAFLFSGIALVAVAEFHIQRVELSESATPLGLLFVLLAAMSTYFYVSVLAAHGDVAESWLVVAIWLGVLVGVASLFGWTKVEGYLLLGAIAFIIIGSLVLLALSLWLWPKLYYEFVLPDGYLAWTPYLMGLVGSIVWGSLATAEYQIRKAVQQRVRADDRRATRSARG